MQKVQTVNINIPGGLNSDMSSIELDILVDKLENTQSSGQVYFELFNPTSGKSYGVEKGSDFALEDKEWHEAYTVTEATFSPPLRGVPSKGLNIVYPFLKSIIFPLTFTQFK